MLERIRESVLDNGLLVLTVENPVSPTASVQLWYRVGSRNERTGITGASHIFEHMMFKGTERHPKGVFDRTIQENGMTHNAFTSHDYTAYYENMSSDRIEVALHLEADRMQGLLLEPEEFESEMSVIREERRQTREDPPYGLISEAVEACVYFAHPYRWPVIGWMTDLETITREELIAYYQVYYRPNNAVLVVAGDIQHERLLDLARSEFGGIPSGPPVPAVKVNEPEQKGERSVEVRKDVQLPGVILAYRAPASVHADAPALNVAEAILFRGRSSRLYQKMIYQQPLAADLSGGFYLRKDPSTFGVRATARPDVPVARVRDVIQETVLSLVSEPPSAKEMEKARHQIEADYVFGQEHNFELGMSLGAEECRSGWRDVFKFQDRSLAVTAEEVAEVSGRIFATDQRTVGYLTPSKEEA
jgi:zinc protease